MGKPILKRFNAGETIPAANISWTEIAGKCDTRERVFNLWGDYSALEFAKDKKRWEGATGSGSFICRNPVWAWVWDDTPDENEWGVVCP